MRVRDSRAARRGSVVHRKRPEELYPSDYPEQKQDKVSAWGSSLKDSVSGNSLVEGFLKFFLTTQTDLTCLFVLKMDGRSRRVQHQRIKGKTFPLVLILPAGTAELSCGHHDTRVKGEMCSQKPTGTRDQTLGPRDQSTNTALILSQTTASFPDFTSESDWIAFPAMWHLSCPDTVDTTGQTTYSTPLAKSNAWSLLLTKAALIFDQKYNTNCDISSNVFSMWIYCDIWFIPVICIWIFSIIPPVFRNLIYCSRNTSDYYQWWKQFTHFCEKRCPRNIKQQTLFNIENNKEH